VALYEAAKRRLLARGAELVHLTTSFRSVPSIQAMVNAAFAPLMSGGEDGSQATYVPLTPFREEPEGRPPSSRSRFRGLIRTGARSPISRSRTQSPMRSVPSSIF
jgi:hypothetical protein